MTNGSTAIVMGASIAGMWTARVLSDYFDTVYVLERDALPDQAEFRSGTPQGRQYHVMLLRGLQIMDDLFPGMREEQIAAGAVPFDVIKDTRTRMRGRWMEQFPSNQILIGCSRVLFESVMRRRLRSIPQIRFIERVEVQGLEMDAAHSSITAVRMRHLDEQESSESTLAADFVVDALGRRSPSPEWLTAAGYPAVQEEIIDPFLGYVTRRYRKPDSVQRSWPMLLISGTPPHNPRGGLILPEEHGTWVVMISGANKDYPPVEEEGFQDFVRSLGPEFYSIVSEGEAISKPYGYRGTASRWLHYERLERWPDRFVVLGDAFCGFNPIYGQGMTVAALAAQALGTELRQAAGQLNGVAQRTMQAIASATQGAWLLATSADLAWPETTGGNQSNAPADRFARWYIDKMLDVMHTDRALRFAFLDVNQLLKPATSLFTPKLMLRVLQASLKKG